MLILIILILYLGDLKYCRCEEAWSRVIDGHIIDVTKALDIVISPQTRGIHVKYSLEMPVKTGSPVMHLYIKRTHLHKRGCIPQKELPSAMAINNAIIKLGSDGVDYGCNVNSAQTTINCKGERKFVLPIDHVWRMAFLYICSSRQKMDIAYNITVTNQRISRRPVMRSMCDHYLNYNYTGVPNILGQTDEADMRMTISTIGLMLNTTFAECYPHTLEMGCRLLLPEYRNGQLVQVCMHTCKDFVVGCARKLLGFGHFVHCPYLPVATNTTECFYKPVMCNALHSPANGRVALSQVRPIPGTTASYSCDMLFKPDTNRNQRICKFSGQWSGKAVTCNHKIEVIIPLVVAALVFLAAIIFILGFVKHKREIHEYKKNLEAARVELMENLIKEIVPFKDTLQAPLPPTHLVYDCFVWHHQYENDQTTDPIDYRFMTDHESGLRIYLEKENHFSLFLPSRDIDAGDDLLEATVDAVKQSAQALIVVSEDLLKDGRNLFAFQMCMLRLISDRQFKIIYLYMSDPQSFGAKIPKLMRLNLWHQHRYLRTDMPTFKRELMLQLGTPLNAQNVQFATEEVIPLM